MSDIVKRYAVSGATIELNKDKKPKYALIGNAYQFADGKIRIKIDSIPVLFNGWIYLNEKKDKPSTAPIAEREITNINEEEAPF